MRYMLALTMVLGANSISLADEEFLGPFPSWADVKRNFGAVGDGKADDTAAIQRGLDALREHRTSCVLYFPAGAYRISKMLKTSRKAHTDCMVSVIGADPATTIIRWDGPRNSGMFQYDAWYAKISRLTLDGAGKAKVALAYGDAFSTYNETSDMVFKDVETGLWLGTASAGQAENAVLRCKFLRCSDAGLRTNGYNSMDIWVWHCRFEDCGYGLLNAAGNFHAYDNLFLRSKTMDIGSKNMMVFGIVHNTSIGSKCFLDWRSAMAWGSPTSLTGNRIIDPVDDSVMRLGNGGPYLVMDNVFKGRSTAKTPQVEMTWGDQTFIGNTYTSTNPVLKAGANRLLDEKIVSPQEIDVTQPSQPICPPHHDRQVFEVATGSNARDVQQLIDRAAKLVGKPPILHFPIGEFRIDHTLLVPANCDVQICGDGASEVATVLRWIGKSQQPLWRFAGPTHASLQDVHMVVGGGSGILIERCDQEGGKIFLEQLDVTGLSPTAKAAAGIVIDGVEESDVLLRNFQGGSWTEKWIEVIGGTKQQQSQKTRGQTSIFCGATGSSMAPYTVEKGGQLVVRSVYHELDGGGNDSPNAISLTDFGALTIDSTRFSYRTSDKTPLIESNSFRGNFAVASCLMMPANSTFPAWFRFRGDGTQCNALCMNCLFWSPEKPTNSETVWKNEAKPPTNAALLLCNVNGSFTEGKGFVRLTDRHATNDDDLIRHALAPLRTARMWLPTQPKVGVTDFYLHRVTIGAGKNGSGMVLRGANK